MTQSGVIAEEAAGASGALLGRDREQSELYALVDGIEQEYLALEQALTALRAAAPS